MTRTSRLPSDQPGCGWYETLPPPKPPRLLEGDQRADWVVLGAGFTGLAAARRLATLQPDSRVVLIDAQRIGFGSAGRNSGFMIDLPHDLTSESYTGKEEEDRKLIRINRAAIAYMREIVQEQHIECDWSEQGKIHAAVEDKGIEALSAFQRGLDSLGEPYTTLDASDLKRITGTTFYRAGMHAPGTVLVQPAALVRGLDETMPENVEVYENSPVIGLTPRDSGIHLECPKGTLTTPRLLLTNNGYASTLGFLKGRLIPADPVGTTVRRLRSNRIIIRNSFTYNPDFTSSEAARRKIRHRHERSFRERFPMLPEVDFEYTWGGVLSLSRNSAPFFGTLMPGIFAAVCQNGLGVARGTISGKLLAEYAVGSDNELLRDMLSFPKPCWNPPDPILGMGVRANILWKEWQAGREL